MLLSLCSSTEGSGGAVCKLTAGSRADSVADVEKVLLESLVLLKKNVLAAALFWPAWAVLKVHRLPLQITSATILRPFNPSLVHCWPLRRSSVTTGHWVGCFFNRMCKQINTPSLAEQNQRNNYSVDQVLLFVELSNHKRPPRPLISKWYHQGCSVRTDMTRNGTGSIALSCA